jgi:hypothetical protein
MSDDERRSPGQEGYWSDLADEADEADEIDEDEEES